MNAGKITVTSTDITFDNIYKKDHVPTETESFRIKTKICGS